MIELVGGLVGGPSGDGDGRGSWYTLLWVWPAFNGGVYGNDTNGRARDRSGDLGMQNT